MIAREEKLSDWTRPSSTTEQERTERMIREAVKEHLERFSS
ncbi:hypothetical protein PS9374_05931 [Planomonospora sphaerica]|uniref:Uncharacterized protein n=1 Tax=Planomonospora sphaerica TaxID=161355 RepID=A0A171DMM7_9ACTN|nr:hypothetical protein PS9374_05931 [Planomonospora sphaerica]